MGDIHPDRRNNHHHDPSRKRSRSPHRNGSGKPWSTSSPSYRSSRDSTPQDRSSRPPQSKWSHKEQIKSNAAQEDERMRTYIAGEDDFMLRQNKKKAVIRVREGRAKPIDWLAVTLRVIDETRHKDRPSLDDEVDDEELEVVDPDSVFEGLGSDKEFDELLKDIETYEKLETNRTNREFWRTMGVICAYWRRKLQTSRTAGGQGRATSSVSADIDRLLAPKTYEQLEGLEGQIRTKLDSNEPIDTDYWSQLLGSLLVWKAKAKVKDVYQAVMEKRMARLRKESAAEAVRSQQELAAALSKDKDEPMQPQTLQYDRSLDPDPALDIAAKDKNLEVRSEQEILTQLATDRARIKRTGYIPMPGGSKATKQVSTTTSKGAATSKSAAPSQFDRDVARGVDEDEEVFAAEEPTTNARTDGLRKPKYFNRVLLGYDWNKYNQTHYTADAPPPRVVQGYKFHIFYPDLPASSPAPSYKIIREDGRKKGQSAAPAGEEDTCILRFVSPGPPYGDVAFRVVDRDWDYSGRRGGGEGGFKSVFEGGVLSLHFGFRRVFYRK
ncbi:uncharacterized protein AB675_3689 [Cyphellophora attinorum]|uniref:Splicing factor Cactin n=1 Tax=Cyphellophora attinorum TaxID=1664694 RepID=A0A0N1H040_9EURO|nr:uncharacterized protein AB675_3689 [Phialophora attinorum]KPI37077.1 hypothetical protein AB675_3689 [Phialophora attinorum]